MKHRKLKWQERIKKGDEFLDSFSGKWKKTVFYNFGERVGYGEKWRRLIHASVGKGE